MLRRFFFLAILTPNFLFSQEKPFQVLVCKEASIYNQEVEPLQYIDDVTSIEIGDGGFLALVHQGGTTYEIREKVFTFYLKPEELKNRSERPPLERLYKDSLTYTYSKLISVLYPPFDRSGFLEWDDSSPLDICWYLHDEPVVNYKLTVLDHEGKKIQDYRTNKNSFELKPNNFGLKEPLFSFRLSRTIAGETIESKAHSVSLKKTSIDYETKASDLVLKALDVELNPLLALEVWKELLKMPNGQEYIALYEKFLDRNMKSLSEAGENGAQFILERN